MMGRKGKCGSEEGKKEAEREGGADVWKRYERTL